MQKSLFITEKPSVAMEFAKALKMSAKRQNGYMEDDQHIITWCRGHLIEMAYPEDYDPSLKTWKMEDLPFLPEKYRYKIIPDAKDQYDTVASLLNRDDVNKIYYSGDSAREGEYIQRLVRMCAGHNPSAEEYRVWIDSQTEEEILRGIREAKPLSEYDALSDSAYARAIEDYLIGMNFSRALSLKYAKIASDAVGGKYHAVAVGRVMSCVLGMVVERERLIRNTKTVSFYSIQAETNGLRMDWKITEQSPYFHTPDNYNNNGLLNRVPVTELVTRMNQAGTLQITENKEKKSQKFAPLLFNLAELQSECTKLFKISPADTLMVAQSLYEKKMTTYPRTDARVLTTAITKVYQANIGGLKAFAPVRDYAEKVLEENLHDPKRMNNTKYVNDALVSDHYAIIPTGQSIEEYYSLSEIEKKIYELICRRFLSIFYPPAETSKRNVAATTCGEMFYANFDKLIAPGYLEVAGYKDDPEGAIAYNHAAGLQGTVPAAFQEREGKSKPPARFTSGSMILAMENAGNLIEDPELREQIKGSGIGTSATRAETISKLERIQYIKIDKKTQTITPDMFGEIVYDILHEAAPNILNPEYTASWEKGLQGIVDGKVQKSYYLEKIYRYVRDMVAATQNSDYREQVQQAIKALQPVYPHIKPAVAGASKFDTGIKCPICGKPLMNGEKNYYCGGYKEGCKFSIYKTPKGKTIPESIVKDLVASWNGDGQGGGASKVSKKISGFVSKTGSKFDAKIQFVMAPGDGVKIKFHFN